MRLDRFISVLSARHLVRPASRRGIPILMYHGISDNLDTHRHPYFRTVTSPEVFALQMRLLYEEGFKVVSLAQAVRCLGGLGHSDHSRVVVLTFDDGLRDFLLHAYPVLAERRFTATIFLSTDYIDGTFPDGRPCLHRTEIRSLQAAGFDFGSHTATHPQLRGVPAAQLKYELSSSRREIEDILSKRIDQFAYPFGFPEDDAPFVESLAASLEEAGYRCGVTTSVGVADSSNHRLFLKRLPVNELDDAALLLAKLSGYYDWMHDYQLLYKRARRQLNSSLRLLARSPSA